MKEMGNGCQEMEFVAASSKKEEEEEGEEEKEEEVEVEVEVEEEEAGAESFCVFSDPIDYGGSSCDDGGVSGGNSSNVNSSSCIVVVAGEIGSGDVLSPYCYEDVEEEEKEVSAFPSMLPVESADLELSGSNPASAAAAALREFDVVSVDGSHHRKERQQILADTTPQFREEEEEDDDAACEKLRLVTAKRESLSLRIENDYAGGEGGGDECCLSNRRIVAPPEEMSAKSSPLRVRKRMEEEEEEDMQTGISEDAEERRKSLVSAARASSSTSSAEVPKFKWGDLDDEDLEQMQQVGGGGDVQKGFLALPTSQQEEDVVADESAQEEELASEIAVAGNSQGVVALLSLHLPPDSQRILLPNAAVPDVVQGASLALVAGGGDSQREFCLQNATTTPEEEEEAGGSSLSEVGTNLDNEVVVSGLAMLAMCELTAAVLAPDGVAAGGSLATRKGEVATKQDDHLVVENSEIGIELENITTSLLAAGVMSPPSQACNECDVQQHSSELSGCTTPAPSAFMATDSGLASVHDCDDPLTDRVMEKCAIVVNTLEASLDGTGDIGSCNPDVVTIDLAPLETSCEGLTARADAALERVDGSVKSAEEQMMDVGMMMTNGMMIEKYDEGECKERFRQRLWCYLFENLNRAIDELYFLCELESDVDQMKEALIVLDEAGVDFKDLKMRVDGFDRVRKGPGLPRPVSAASTSSSISSKDQQRRPRAIAWEVRRVTTTSQHRADMLSSSLEALKKAQSAQQAHSRPQGRRRDTSRVLSFDRDPEDDVFSKFLMLRESVCPLRESDISKSRENPPPVREPAVISVDSSSKSKDSLPSRRDIFLKSKDPLSVFKEVPGKLVDAIPVSRDSPSKPRESQSSKNRSLNLEPPLNAERQHCDSIGFNAEDCAPSEVVTYHHSTSSARASPQEKETGKKGGSLKDEMLTNRSTDSMGKRSTSSASQIDRFMRPTASSGQRVASREREQNLPVSKSPSMEAWKEKRNWEDILSSPLNIASRVSRSPGPGRKSTERVRVLHDKLMSPERKKKTPTETKKEQEEKQARATRLRMELEMEKVQRLQRTTEKLTRVSEWQAVRSSRLREGMHARQQRGESRHEAHLAQIARRASDESCKVSEVRFITSLSEENRKLSLQQKLQDSETRRAERLQNLRIKQKEDYAREEAAQERRRHLEAERLQRIAEAQRRKEEGKARREEERKAASAAREARAVEHVRKKEVRAKAQQEEAELLGQKLAERLRESALRRKVYLEQIKERAIMDLDKQDKRSRDILSESPVRLRDQISPSGRRTSSREKVAPGQIFESDSVTDRDLTSGELVGSARSNIAAGLYPMAGSNDSIPLQKQALKKRVKKLRQRLASRKSEFLERSPGVDAYGMGSASLAGAARSRIGRWLQELGRLQQTRKPGNFSVSCLIIAEMVKYLEDKEAELHAARQQGLLDYIATALPASHSSKPEASALTVALLRLLAVLLSPPANRSYFIVRNLLPPLIPMLSTALENFSTIDYSLNNQGANVVGSGPGCNSSKDGPAASKDAVNSLSGSMKDEKMSADEKLEVMQEVLEGLLWAVTAIIGHDCLEERQLQMQEDLAELIVACEVLHRLRNLFALFDRPQVEGAAIPGPVLLGLRLLETLTGPRGKILTAAHEAPVNINGCLPCLPPTSDIGNSVIIEDGAEESIPHLPDVSEQVLKGDDVFFIVPGPDTTEEEQGEKIEEKNGEKSKTSDTSVAHGQASVVLNMRTKYLLAAIAETGLLGLPSLLTAVLLHANPRSSPEQAACALPSNFEEVATSVLRVLNNVARLDLPLLQNMLGLPDLRMEFFHLVSFLLSHCTCKWKTTTDKVAALLLETLLLLGYTALLHPGNQAVLRWGKSPTILHKMCDLPFAFFSDPKLTPVLIVTLLAVCYGSERNRDVVQQELSMDMLLTFLKRSREKITQVTESENDTKPEDEEVVVKTKAKVSWGSESESGGASTARGRSRQKQPLPDVFFSSPKRVNWNQTRNGVNINMTSSDGDIAAKETKSTVYRSGGRSTPITDLQTLPVKRSKGGSSSFLSSSLPSRFPTVSLPQSAASGTNELLGDGMASFPFPAALTLQNRFPESLWTQAEEFFSPGSRMGRIFKA